MLDTHAIPAFFQESHTYPDPLLFHMIICMYISLHIKGKKVQLSSKTVIFLHVSPHTKLAEEISFHHSVEQIVQNLESVELYGASLFSK